MSNNPVKKILFLSIYLRNVGLFINNKSAVFFYVYVTFIIVIYASFFNSTSCEKIDRVQFKNIKMLYVERKSYITYNRKVEVNRSDQRSIKARFNRLNADRVAEEGSFIWMDIPGAT